LGKVFTRLTRSRRRRRFAATRTRSPAAPR
jgi:hypothetical protein